MQSSDAVDAMTTDNREMGHADRSRTVFGDQRKIAQSRRIAGPALRDSFEKATIDFKDYLQMSRQNAAQHLHRPNLQRLGQQRVVRVSEAGLRQFPGALPFQTTLVHQHPHQFRNRQRRMSVVKLDRDFIRQLVERVVFFLITADDVS